LEVRISARLTPRTGVGAIWRRSGRRVRHLGLLFRSLARYCVVNRRVWPLLAVLLLLAIGVVSTTAYVVTPLLYPLF
jgi:hypothetical protein